MLTSRSSYSESPAPRNAPASITIPAGSAHEWVLENGLTLIVQEDHSAPVSCVQAWCKTGSIHEGRWLGAGLSHILEHLLFKGTTSRSSSQIVDAVQDGGGYINAYTSFDRTVYYIDTPSAGTSGAIDILCDVMMNSTLPVDEYAKEQEVIRREFAMGFDDPSRVSSRLLFSTAYRTHPYRHPVIGYLDVFDQLTRDDVMSYYKRRYVPNNMGLIVVGDVDAGAVHREVVEWFKAVPRQPLEPVLIPVEPAQMGRREIHEEFQTELTRLSMAWHVPAVTDPDMPALDVLSTLFGSGRSSRLYRVMREEKELVHSISSYSYTPACSGLFGVSALLDPENREQVQAAVSEMTADIIQNGVTPMEVRKAQKMILAGHLDQLGSASGQADDLGSNWLLTGNLDFNRNYLDAIQRVTPGDVQRVAGKWLRDERLCITSLNPTGSLANTLPPGETPRAAEFQKFTLSNGLRVVVREDHRLPVIDLSMVFTGGLLSETPATNGIGRLMARTLFKGTVKRTADEIADALESVGGSFGADSGNNSFQIALRVMTPDLMLGLDVLSDVLHHATFPEKAVQREKEAQMASIKAEEDQMLNVARGLMRETLFAGHPYALRGNGSAASLGGITRGQVAAFAKSHLVAMNGVLAVFGDVTAAGLKPMLEEALGTLEAGEAALSHPQETPRLSESIDTTRIRDKSQAVLVVGFRGASIKSEDRAALEILDHASSDLGSRFFVRIREKLGLAYYIGATQFLGMVPGAFHFYLGTDPTKIEKVQTELLDEIALLARDGLTAEELFRAKNKIRGHREIANQDNQSFAHSCALDELYGLGAEYYKAHGERLQNVTAEAVREAALQYFGGQPRVIAVVKPATIEIEQTEKEEYHG